MELQVNKPLLTAEQDEELKHAAEARQRGLRLLPKGVLALAPRVDVSTWAISAITFVIFVIINRNTVLFIGTSFLHYQYDVSLVTN